MEDFPVFPDPPAITVERTLAIIKPDAIRYADSIMEEIKVNGFTILQVSAEEWSIGMHQVYHGREVVACNTAFLSLRYQTNFCATGMPTRAL